MAGIEKNGPLKSGERMRVSRPLSRSAITWALYPEKVYPLPEGRRLSDTSPTPKEGCATPRA